MLLRHVRNISNHLNLTAHEGVEKDGRVRQQLCGAIIPKVSGNCLLSGHVWNIFNHLKSWGNPTTHQGAKKGWLWEATLQQLWRHPTLKTLSFANKLKALHKFWDLGFLCGDTSNLCHPKLGSRLVYSSDHRRFQHLSSSFYVFAAPGRPNHCQRERT